MTARAAVFDILRDAQDPAADHALLLALRESDLATAHPVVETLLDRRTQAGLYGLIEWFHAFDDAICLRILERLDVLFPVLRSASQSRVERVRLNVLDVIRRGRACRAAYLVDSALHDRSAHVREAAAETLYALADQFFDDEPESVDESAHVDPDEARQQMIALARVAEDRRQVIHAIEGGLESFSMHLHPRVVEAAMWFVDELGERFWSIVAAPGSRAARVGVNVITAVRSPRLVPFSMMALSTSVYRAHVVKGLANCTDPAILTEWLRQSWRLAEPRVARAMTAIRGELSCLHGRGAQLLQDVGDQQRHIPRWLRTTGIPIEAKLGLFKELERRGNGDLRRRVAWDLTLMPDDRATSLLRQFARGDHPDTAVIARNELGRREPLEYPPGALLTGTSPEARGRPARSPTEPTPTFDRYWNEFDQLSPHDRRTVGRRMLAENATVVSGLTRRLSTTDPYDRVRALRIIAALGLADTFTDDLYKLSYDNDCEVRSAAVLALGQLPGPTSRRILQNALSDQDLRVQANAIEAVEQSTDPFVIDELKPKLASANNRVRANAVKALLKLGVREAAETLVEMLQHPDRSQRISALWLVEEMGLSPLASRIMEIARTDDDEQVRERALELARAADDLLAPSTDVDPPADPEVGA